MTWKLPGWQEAYSMLFSLLRICLPSLVYKCEQQQQKKESNQKEKQSISTGCVNDLKVTWLTRGIQYVVLVTEKLIKRIHVNRIFTFTISDLFQFVVVNSWSDANCYHPHVLFLGNEWPCSLRFLGLATSDMNLEYIWGLCFSCFNGFVSLDRFWIFLHYDLYVIQKDQKYLFR